MKTIGLIGGMSWESSADYYRFINEGIKKKIGGLHSGKILLYSFDFDEIEKLQHQGRWDELREMLTQAGEKLTLGGADMIALCTNTMHLVCEGLEKSTLPFLHIADATSTVIRDGNYKKVGLLATKFTMEKDFYRTRVQEKSGCEIIIPSEKERDTLHRIIYEELCAGIISPESEKQYRDVIGNLVNSGCEAIILGCTEIGMLIQQENYTIPLFDSTRIHCEAIVEAILI